MGNQFIPPAVADVMQGQFSSVNGFPVGSGLVIERIDDGLYQAVLPDGRTVTVNESGEILKIS